MKRILTNIIIIACFLLFASCSSTKKNVANNNVITKSISQDKKDIVAYEVTNCSSESGIEFMEYPDIKLSFPKGMQVPKNYKIFNTQEDVLKTFMEMRKQNAPGFSGITVPFLINNKIECAALYIEPITAMTKELMAKYPDIITLKGHETSDKSKTARITYSDSAGLNIEYTIGANKYFLIRISNNDGNNYYITYEKNDPNLIKESIK